MCDRPYLLYFIPLLHGRINMQRLWVVKKIVVVLGFSRIQYIGSTQYEV